MITYVVLANNTILSLIGQNHLHMVNLIIIPYILYQLPHLKKSPKNQRPNKALYFPKGNQIVKMHYYDYLGL